MDRFAGWLRRGDHGLGGEIKRNAQHVGIFDVEAVFLIQIVGQAAQGTANHLLAQQLRTEGADTEDMGHIRAIPTFGEHGHRHHATDGFAETVFLADGVHHLAQ